MKKLVISSLFLVFAINLFAQRSQSDLILKLLEDQRQAWNRGDLNEYMQGYNQSDSLILLEKAVLNMAGIIPLKIIKRVTPTNQRWVI
jgi:hypothetical protein